MITSRVTPFRRVAQSLRAGGFERTNHTTQTGTFWKHTRTGKHLLVPKAVQGYYPNEIIYDLEARITALGLQETAAIVAHTAAAPGPAGTTVPSRSPAKKK